MVARSYLFVPGDRRDMLDKVAGRGADAVIADLEDAVAPSAKATARAEVAGWLAELRSPPFEVWVRVNPGGSELPVDLGAVCGWALTGIMVPKVDSAAQLGTVAGLLAAHEAEAGRRPGDIRLLPIVETAMGFLDVAGLAGAPRVHQLMIGELDLGADLGVDPTDDAAFLPLRMQVVVASAAAGIAGPVGPVSPDFRDLESLRTQTARLARLGFWSRPAIHPAQVPVYNDVLTPAESEVAEAQRLVELYQQALAEGRGAVVDDHGRMVDEAVVKVARRLLARAQHHPGGSA